MKNKCTTLLVFLMLIMFGLEAQAQSRISGVLTDEATNAPLIGVAVTVKNTTIGTFTDLDGKYSIEIPGDKATLVYSYIGYESKEVDVTSDIGSVSFAMSEGVNVMDEVVVSGLASTVKRRNLANAVSSVSAKELTGVTSQQTMDGALYGKIPGANITSNSGAPGGGISMKLRGVTTITGASQPLYILDGVYLDNSAIPASLNLVSKAAAGGSASNQDNPSNRIADLNPDDIESIEILKGASAAAIYGARAAAGVVIINTKRGENGKTRVSVNQTLGANFLLNPLGQRDWDATKVEAGYGASEVATYNAAVAAGNIYDYEKEMYGNVGFSRTSNVGISGGNKNTKIFSSFTVKDEAGIVKNTGYAKNAIRLNLDQKLFDFMDLQVSTNYINAHSDRGFFNNDNSGTTMGISFIQTPSWADLLPDADGNFPNNSYSSANFLQTAELMTNRETVNRFIPSVKLTTRLHTTDNSNLRLILQGGLDYYTLGTQAIFPKELQFQKDGNGTNGASILGNTTTTNTNVSGFLVHSFYPSNSKFSLTSQAGLTQVDINQNTLITTATDLIGSQTNLDQAGSKSTEHFRSIQKDKGFFIQEEVNYGDQFLVTLGLRGDKSSTNGDPNKLYFFPKASLAVNLHEFNFWGSETLDQFKIRAAFGQAGNFASFGSIYTSLAPVVFNGTVGSLINTNRGNETIEPERQTEIEAGFDLGFLKNKMSFGATYYRKSVQDLIISVGEPTSSGFSSRTLNPADIQNQGLELVLNATPVRTNDFQWNSSTAFWMNRAIVTRLDVPAYTFGAFGATLGTLYLEEGSSPTQLVGIGPSEMDENGDGLVVFGDAEPDFNMSFNNSLGWKGLEFNFLLHLKQGGENINLSALLTDIYGTSPDYDDMTLDPSGDLSNGEYRLSTLGSTADAWIVDASYLRLREVGLYYTIPRKNLGDVADIRLGVSGRNLLNVFSYNSYDPEVSNFGAAGISGNVEVTPFPSAKSVFFHIGATF